MLSLPKLREAATDPAHALAWLASRQFPRRPRSAKALFHAARWLERNPAERLLRHSDIALVDRDLTSALKFLRKAIESQPQVSTVYSTGIRLARSDFDARDFQAGISATVADTVLKDMLIALLRSPRAYHPSRFWLYFMLYNAYQIDTMGLADFKRTANKNYFTWTADAHIEEQTNAIEAIIGSSRLRAASGGPKPAEFGDDKWRRYKHFLAALYSYAKLNDRLGVLDRLEEPSLGNPIYAEIDGRRISQDLCHTTIELNAIIPEIGWHAEKAFTAYELGAGHGRIGLALLTLFPNARYVVIDIPPALHVSQWYLSTLLGSGRTFRWRQFDSYRDVAAEFEASRVAFLLPHQAAMLPDKSADLFVNVCSIQEMTREHVSLWFREIDRLCRGYFFTKQYLRHANHIDDIEINRGDYPVRPDWKVVFDRVCEGFPSLFEALFSVPQSRGTLPHGQA